MCMYMYMQMLYRLEMGAGLLYEDRSNTTIAFIEFG